MTRETDKLNLLGQGMPQMEALVELLGEKKFRAAQIMKWIHHRHMDDFAGMSDLSLSTRERLAEVAEIREPEIIVDYDANGQVVGLELLDVSEYVPLMKPTPAVGD